MLAMMQCVAVCCYVCDHCFSRIVCVFFGLNLATSMKYLLHVFLSHIYATNAACAGSDCAPTKCAN